MNRRDFNKALLAAPIVVSIPMAVTASPEYEHITIARGFTIKAGLGPTEEQLNQLKDGFMDVLKEVTAGKQGVSWRMKPQFRKESRYRDTEDRYKVVARLSIAD